MNHFPNLIQNVWRILILSLLTLLSICYLFSKVKIKTPSPPEHIVHCSRYGSSNSSSSSSNNKKRQNNRDAIYANGHNVILSSAGYGSFNNELTKIWVDLDDNGKEYDGTDDELVETLIGDLSDVYIYGGSLDANVMKNINIKMTGGNVGGIFGGGYALNNNAEVTGDVTITVSGGTISLVDGGGEEYDSKYSSLVRGNVDILLYDCNYSGKYYINDNRVDQIKGLVRVRDFSKHTYGSNCEWGSTKAGFQACMIQTGPNELYIDWRNAGYGVIPSVNLSLDKLTITQYSYIKNGGDIQMNSCKSGCSELGTVTGNAIKLPHQPSNIVRSRDSYSHKVPCSICGVNMTISHTFRITESTSASVSGAKHRKECTVCQYQSDESCNLYHTIDDDNTHHLWACRDCGHILTETAVEHLEDYDVPANKRYKEYNNHYHTCVCAVCNSTFRKEHRWTAAEVSTCKDCGSTKHTHNYQNGICTGCQYSHQCKESDFKPGSTSCSVCGKGCSHANMLFNVSESNTSNGHYSECQACHQIIKIGEHSMIEDSQRGYVCSYSQCQYGCDHASHLALTPGQSVRTYATPNGSISYDVEHNDPACTQCGSNIACKITDTKGKEYYMTTLKAAFSYAAANKMAEAVITLLRNNQLTERVNATLEDMTMTLDMNNCDIIFSPLKNQSSISVAKGTLNIINSPFATTGQYANLYNSNSVSTIDVQETGSVSLDGVHVSQLNIGTRSITLGDVEVEGLKVNAKTVPVKITDNVTIYSFLSCNSYAIMDVLPKGYILTEYQEDQTWNRLYDHTSNFNKTTGPLNRTNLLRIEKCSDHTVEVSISHSDSGHDGTCIHCLEFVNNLPHKLDKSGHKYDDQYHYKKCSICGYEDETERHDFDETTGTCTAPECKAQAIVEIHQQDNDVKLYYSTFENAWQNCRIGYSDTIVLKQDIEVKEPLEISYEKVAEEDGSIRYATPYIHITSKGMTLRYTGEGNPLSVAENIDAKDALYFCAGLKCSSNWATAAIPAHTVAGAIFTDSKTEVITCPEHQYAYQEMRNEEGSNLPYHECTCMLCNWISDQNHIYEGTDHCTKCGVERVIVANGTIGEGNEMIEIAKYGSMNEAFQSASDYSAEHETPVTIHVLRDVDVEVDENSHSYISCLWLHNPKANIIIDAIDPDDPNHQFYITGHESPGSLGHLLYVESGTLTILSGIYQSYRSAISYASDCTAVIRLKGGTYLRGIYATVNNVDGIMASYLRYRGENESAGLASMIAPGYVLELIESNHEHNSPRQYRGDFISYNSPHSVVSGSGTIYKCDHPSTGGWIEARAVTCYSDGHPRYYRCHQCGAYITESAGQLAESNLEEITEHALGHEYDENGVCQRQLTDLEGNTYVCGQLKRAVSVKYQSKNRNTGETVTNNVHGSEEKFYEDFLTAWNENQSLGSAEEVLTTCTFTLMTDVDLSYLDDSDNGNTDFALVSKRNNIEIDLNGHALNLGSNIFDNNDGSYYYQGQDTLIIRDSQKSGQTIPCNIVFDNGRKSLHLKDVALSINNSMRIKGSIIMEGTSGLILSDEPSLEIGMIYADSTCFIEGHGISALYISSGTGQSKDLSKAMHNTQFYQIEDNGNISDMEGEGYSIYHDDIQHYSPRLEMYDPNGKMVASNIVWRATVPSEPVQHSFVGRLQDKEELHSGICTRCGFESYGEHEYVNHMCLNCGHKPDVYTVIEGITTDYTLFSEAVSALTGKCGTVVLNKDVNGNCTITDSADITLNLNDYKLTSRSAYAIYVDQAKLTINSGAKGMGSIENTHPYGSGIIVSKHADNHLVINNGEFHAPDGALLVQAAQINAEGYPSVMIRGGSFSSIHTESSACDILRMLDTNTYFRSSDDDKLIETSLTQTNSGSANSISYLDNVYAYNSDMALTAGKEVAIDNHGEATAEQYAALISEAMNNIGVCSFGQTNISQNVDLHDAGLIMALQRAVSAAGYSRLVTLEDDLQAYVEAKLLATTVQSVEVIGSAEDAMVHALTRMTFDVQPYASLRVENSIVSTPINTEMVNGAVTFRLPVDARFNAAYLYVYRTDESGNRELLGEYAVQTNKSNDGTFYKFVEIETEDFVTFDYQAMAEFTLADAETFKNEFTNTFEKLSYHRSFQTANQWEALYIPMSIAPSLDCDIADIYTFGNMVDTNQDGAINEEDDLVLIVDKLSAGESTEANVPYLIRSASAGDQIYESADNVLYPAESYAGTCSTSRTKFTFHGIYSAQKMEQNGVAYTLQGGSIQTLSGTLVPQRWYIDVLSRTDGYNAEIEQAEVSCIRIFTIGEELEEETVLRLLKGDKVDVWQNGKCYTLDGRRATQPQKGLSIRNRKKVFEAR